MLGIQQFFVERVSDAGISLVVGKVMEDVLLFGPRQKLEKFHHKLRKESKIGRFTVNEDLLFNGLTIHQEPDLSISVSMKEFLAKSLPIDISCERRKQ